MSTVTPARRSLGKWKALPIEGISLTPADTSTLTRQFIRYARTKMHTKIYDAKEHDTGQFRWLHVEVRNHHGRLHLFLELDEDARSDDYRQPCILELRDTLLDFQGPPQHDEIAWGMEQLLIAYERGTTLTTLAKEINHRAQELDPEYVFLLSVLNTGSSIDADQLKEILRNYKRSPTHRHFVASP